MLGFVIALLFGLAQMFLLSKMLKGATSGNIRVLAVYLAAKLVAYIAAVLLVLLVFPNSLIACACGYAAGLPIGAIVYFICFCFKHPQK